jgi:NADH dehydrogenase
VSAQPLNVVLIGGTGFIGQHLAARLSDDGVGVLALARHYESAKQLTMLPGVDVDVANVHDDAVLRKLLAGRDAVINLVGVLHGGLAGPMARASATCTWSCRAASPLPAPTWACRATCT